MGTNFYRVPKGNEMIRREQKLRIRLDAMDTINPSDIIMGYKSVPNSDLEMMSPWDEFLDGTNVHIGKRSNGWKFLWNWNNEKYYKTKDELFKFIRTGRIIDEYGNQLSTSQFIEMALEWGKDDGWDLESYYEKYPELNLFPQIEREKNIDGLRVSTSIDFE